LAGVVGGISDVPIPFGMLLDRVFLFLVRDNVIKARLFAGVVMNPAEQ
jgi:serine protease inhibitor